MFYFVVLLGIFIWGMFISTFCRCWAFFSSSPIGCPYIWMTMRTQMRQHFYIVQYFSSLMQLQTSAILIAETFESTLLYIYVCMCILDFSLSSLWSSSLPLLFRIFVTQYFLCSRENYWLLSLRTLSRDIIIIFQKIYT